MVYVGGSECPNEQDRKGGQVEGGSTLCFRVSSAIESLSFPSLYVSLDYRTTSYFNVKSNTNFQLFF